MCLKNYRLIVLFCLFYFIYAKSASDGWCDRNVITRKTRTVFGQNFTYTTTMLLRECCVGYRRHGSKCVTICETKCPPNSVCKSRDFCVCQENYTQISVSNLPDRLRCQPICGAACSAHSKCLGSGRCVCDVGYKLKWGQCQPICKPHCPIDSYCKSPGNCVCHAGYIKSSAINSTSYCKPQCRNECPKHSVCIRRDVCACEMGYRHLEKSPFRNETQLCAPICESPRCGTNSFCQAPNQCSCLTGYTRNSTNDICAPVCTVECPKHSICSAPDHCTCDDGYEINEQETECIPICSQPCPEQSLCYRPNECRCDDGYRLQQEPGVNLYCEPICAQNCSAYGKCVAPNKCKCLPGYGMQHEFPEQPLCQPICSHGCEHGHCFAPEICVCDPGYLMGPGEVCSPVCEPDCVNANCTAPNICNCRDEYITSEKVHICILKCSEYIFDICFPAFILDSYQMKLIGIGSAAIVISIISIFFFILCRRQNIVDLVDDDVFIIQFGHQLEQEIIAQPI